MTPRRATSADVARRAGVSRATVSYVLNDAPHQSIPDATRKRVLDAARELDYTPHAAARALRAGHSSLVLLINTGIPYGTNLSAAIDALATQVAATGRSLVVWQQRDSHDLAATLAHLQPALVIALGELDEEQRTLLARAGIPRLESAAGGDPERLEAGAALQVHHLASRGHRRLAYLTTEDPALTRFAAPRLAAVRAACADLDLDPPEVGSLADLRDSAADRLAVTLREWTTRPDPVTAVACYNDVAAAACLAAAADLALDVPRDLAVVGMDDEPMSPFLRPALTTVRLEMADYARQVWSRAQAALDGARPSEDSSAIPYGLVERAST